MSNYDYPPDEFDQPAEPGQSVGIHRTGRSTWSKLWPFLLVIILFALLAYGLVAWFASDSDETPPPATTTQEETPEPEETEETEEESPSEEPEEAEEPTEEPEDTEDTEEPTEEAAELDMGIAIRVLNATNQQGLAATGNNLLTDAGWTNTEAANYTGDPIQATAVWYKDEEQAAEAEQIAEDLGVDAPVLVPSLIGPVSVILAGDFTG